jgi:hypothetical protein
MALEGKLADRAIKIIHSGGSSQNVKQLLFDIDNQEI